MSRPYGLPLKQGYDEIPASDMRAMEDFVRGGVWRFPDVSDAADANDPLLAKNPPYGAFMLGFDFHHTPSGPKLIEINTNAAGFATTMLLYGETATDSPMARRLADSLLAEYRLAGRSGKPKLVAVVDDAAVTQPFYPEMLRLAEILEAQGIPAVVISPGDMMRRADGLFFKGRGIDFIYNRLTDFRLREPSHAPLRQAVIADQVVLAPHPATYVRVADKGNLLRLNHPLNPKSCRFSERSVEEWREQRKGWVFKPSQGAAAKGVYRGDKLTVSKLKTLPPDTIVQEMVFPSMAADGSKYDVRLYAHGTDPIATVARHYGGQVMEMRSELAGFRAVRTV